MEDEGLRPEQAMSRYRIIEIARDIVDEYGHELDKIPTLFTQTATKN